VLTGFDLEQEVLEPQVEWMHVGMPIENFQAVFSRSISQGGDKRSEGAVTAYEVA
jgi:hypothetical protein